ncbi:unnamed protein product [Acanthoscelides obtectus]|uniref:Reverse transcriptase domain-containing protein n=1 Tax=Acanthoscelides obtectus TaxID=200917 RepID=A0A9P0P5W6_ACAOB|nr:unnamed protein product [Acanthoscelides obtectus]CAK1643002.1 hypothetical protein AOBTE_LOCUS13355 [Acanthoscelides obtectus]
MITIISDPLLNILNTSLIEGEFPEALKFALVLPIYKKGDPDDMNNYRAISLLMNFSKIFEIAYNNRLTNFFHSNKYFTNNQHGFMKGRGRMSTKWYKPSMEY